MAVHVSQLAYQRTTAVTQLCASSLKVTWQRRVKTSRAGDGLWKAEVSLLHRVSSPSQVLWGPITTQLSSRRGTSYHITKGS